jgi:hypothetical protein
MKDLGRWELRIGELRPEWHSRGDCALARAMGARSNTGDDKGIINVNILGNIWQPAVIAQERSTST